MRDRFMYFPTTCNYRTLCKFNYQSRITFQIAEINYRAYPSKFNHYIRLGMPYRKKTKTSITITDQFDYPISRLPILPGGGVRWGPPFVLIRATLNWQFNRKKFNLNPGSSTSIQCSIELKLNFKSWAVKNKSANKKAKQKPKKQNNNNQKPEKTWVKSGFFGTYD